MPDCRVHILPLNSVGSQFLLPLMEGHCTHLINATWYSLSDFVIQIHLSATSEWKKEDKINKPEKLFCILLVMTVLQLNTFPSDISAWYVKTTLLCLSKLALTEQVEELLVQEEAAVHANSAIFRTKPCVQSEGQLQRNSSAKQKRRC